MQREDKQLDSSLESLIQRVNDIKTGISTLIYKIENEYETMNWPSLLDSYALISGHLTALSKVLSHDKCPPLRNLTVLPLLLSPERDECLAQLTENRLQMFCHDIVPDYLRTKLEQSVESKLTPLENKVNSLSQEAAQKQIATYQKVTTHVWDIVNKAREEWEVELSARTGPQQNNSPADTQLLVAAIGMGKGLKMMPSNQGGVPNMMMGPVGRPMMNTSSMAPNQSPMIKAPSSIKTNIKSASQIHPYIR